MRRTWGRLAAAAALAAVWVSGCGDDDTSAPDDGATESDGADADGDGDADAAVEAEGADGDGDAGADVEADGDGEAEAGADADGDGDADGGHLCPRDPAPADRRRYVVVSRPYDASGAGAATYEVLALGTGGELERGGATFSMGRSTAGEIAFTPDGELGFVAQEDGTVGVFRLDGAGTPEVLAAGLEGAFYASSVTIDPLGDVAYVLDSEWRAADGGGGIYALRIGCDDSVFDAGMVAPAKLPYAMEFVPGRPDRTVVAAADILDVTVGPDVHLLDWGTSPAVLSRADAFGDDEQIVSAGAVTRDGRYALFADNAAFSGIPNRVAVVAIDGDGLRAVGMLEPFDDPVALAASPFDDAVLVALGFGDAIEWLSYDPAHPDEPFVAMGPLAYAGGRPQLPSAAVQVERGTLAGLVLVAEVSGIRRVRFDGAGGVEDLGRFEFGSGLDNIVGAIGVQP
ncbi:MAG: hypothetical protein GYA57_04275 [Myxococcales bacterium]|nr:hypothetical protein [Myxococcales bacterium]